MRRRTCLCLTTIALLVLCALPSRAETDQEVAARKVALDLAGEGDGLVAVQGDAHGPLDQPLSGLHRPRQAPIGMVPERPIRTRRPGPV